MNRNSKGLYICWLFFLIALALFWVGSYHYSYWRDFQLRPWAYSQNKQVPLLIGKWEGQFRDPDGVDKTILMEFFEPLSDLERWKKAGYFFDKNSRNGEGIKVFQSLFEGKAQVNSRLGQENYLFKGKVTENDFHRFSLECEAQDPSKRIHPNFGVKFCKAGFWKNDAMNFAIEFAYFNEKGFNFYDSGDARFLKVIKVELRRVN